MVRCAVVLSVLLGVAGYAPSWAAPPPITLNIDGRSASLIASPLITPGAQLIVVGADGQMTSRPLTAKTFRRVGTAASWARATVRADGSLAGAVVDGKQVTVLDGAAGTTTAAAVLDTAVGACPPPLIGPSRPHTAPMRRLTAAGGMPVAGLGIVGDHVFVQRAGGVTQATNRIVEVFNVVDGIFQSQHGVALQIERLLLFEVADPTLSTTTNINTTLNEIAAYWDAHATDTLAGVDTVQLVSGRSFDGNTIGLAWLDQLCVQHWGSSVTELQHYSDVYTRALLAAHELGHTFAAPHDAQEGSPCSFTDWGKWIMNPVLGSSLLNQFSQCTKAQVAPAVARSACLGMLSEPPPPAATNTPTPRATPTATVRLSATATTAPLVQAAAFVSQTVPAEMVAGASYAVAISMRNTGTMPWTAAERYRLGSQSPQDTTRWGKSRVGLASTETIAPEQAKTFAFTVTAPAVPGVYHLQWRMLQEAVVWFGAYSPDTLITVIPAAISPTATFPVLPTASEPPTPLPTGTPRLPTATRAAPTRTPAGTVVPTVGAYAARLTDLTTFDRLRGGGYMFVSVRAENTGTATWNTVTWSTPVRLVPLPFGSQTWGMSAVPVLRTLPGGQTTIVFTIKPPLTPGTYVWQWQLAVNGKPFGAPTAPRLITVW